MVLIPMTFIVVMLTTMTISLLTLLSSSMPSLLLFLLFVVVAVVVVVVVVVDFFRCVSLLRRYCGDRSRLARHIVGLLPLHALAALSLIGAQWQVVLFIQCPTTTPTIHTKQQQQQQQQRQLQQQ